MAGIATNGVYLNNLTVAPTADVPAGHWLLYSKDTGIYAVTISGGEHPIDSSAVVSVVAGTSAILQAQITPVSVAADYLASVTGDFALTTDVAALTGSLYGLIGSTSAAANSTPLTTTAALTGALQTQIDTNNVAIGYLASVTGGFSLTTSLQTTAGNILSYSSAASANALVQANANTTSQLANYTTLAATNALTGQLALTTSLQTTAGNLYALIATTSGSGSGIYTPLTTTAGLTGSLQSQIDANNVAIGYLAGVTGGFALTTSLQTTAGNLQSQVTNNNVAIGYLASITGGFATTTSVAALTGQLALDSNVVHKTGTETINGSKTFGNDVTINGNLTVNGGTTSVTSQQVLASSNLIVVNNGGTAPIAAGFAGIEVQRGTNPLSAYLFVFEESRSGFVVGLSGQTQLVASRENTPVIGGVAFWDGTNYRFDTNSTLTSGSIVNLQNAVSYLASVTGGFAQSVDVAALTGQLALNTNVVHITGNEGISGNKTFVNLSVLSQGVNNFTVKSITGGAQAILDGISGTNRRIIIRSSGSNRWIFGADGATEAGADSGTNFFISAFNDVGSTIDTPLAVNRAAGNPLLTSRPMNISGQATAFNIVSVNGISANGNLPVVTTDMLAALSGSGSGISSAAVASLTGQLTPLTTTQALTGQLLTSAQFGNTSGSFFSAYGGVISGAPLPGALALGTVTISTSSQAPLTISSLNGAVVRSYAYSGSTAAPSSVTAGTQLLKFNTLGHTGSAFTANRASLAFEATSQWTSASNETDIRFLTTPQNSVVGTDRMVIWGDGSLQLGGNLTNTIGGLGASNLVVAGSISASNNIPVALITDVAALTGSLQTQVTNHNVAIGYLASVTGSMATTTSVAALTGQLLTSAQFGNTSGTFYSVYGGTISGGNIIHRIGTTPLGIPILNGFNGSISGTSYGMRLAGVGGARYQGHGYSGTTDSPSALASGLEMASLIGFAFDGATWAGPLASIRTLTTETINTTSHATAITFRLTNSGTLTETEKARIWGDGSVQIGGTVSQQLGASNLVVAGSISANGNLPVVTTNMLAATSGQLVAGIYNSGSNTYTIQSSIFVQRSNPQIDISGVGRDWMLQSVDADGRFRIYDNTAGSERLTIYPGFGTSVAGGLSANGNLPVVTTDMLAALSGAGGGVSSATVAALTGQLVKKAGDTMTGLFELSNSVTVPPIELQSSDISSGFRIVGDQAQKQMYQYSFNVNNAGYRMVTVDGSASAPANIATGRVVGQVAAYGRYGAGLHALSRLVWQAEQPYAASGAGTSCRLSYIPPNSLNTTEFITMNAGNSNILGFNVNVTGAGSIAAGTNIIAKGNISAANGLFSNNNLAIANTNAAADIYINTAGAQTGTPQVTLRTDSRYDAITNKTAGLTFETNTSVVGSITKLILSSASTSLTLSGQAGINYTVDATQGGGSVWKIGDGIGAGNGTFVIYDYTNSKAAIQYDNSGNLNFPNSSLLNFGSQTLKNKRTALGAQYIIDLYYNGNTPSSQLIADCNNGDFYIDVSAGRNLYVRSGVNGTSGTMMSMYTDSGFVTRANIGSTYNKVALSLGAGSGLIHTFDGGNSYIETGTGALVLQTDTANPIYLRTNGSNVAVTVDASQNVGIGAVAPSSKLTVTTTASNDGIRVTDGTVTSILYNTSSNSGTVGTVSNHPFNIYTNNAAAVQVGANQVTNFVLSPTVSGSVMGNTIFTDYFVQTGSFSDPGGNNGDVVYVV